MGVGSIFFPRPAGRAGWVTISSSWCEDPLSQRKVSQPNSPLPKNTIFMPHYPFMAPLKFDVQKTLTPSLTVGARIRQFIEVTFPNQRDIIASSQIAVNGLGGLAAEMDGMNDQGCAFDGIAGGKNTGDGGHIIGIGFDIALVIEGQSQILN